MPPLSRYSSPVHQITMLPTAWTKVNELSLNCLTSKIIESSRRLDHIRAIEDMIKKLIDVLHFFVILNMVEFCFWWFASLSLAMSLPSATPIAWKRRWPGWSRTLRSGETRGRQHPRGWRRSSNRQPRQKKRGEWLNRSYPLFEPSTHVTSRRCFPWHSTRPDNRM